MFFVCFSNAVEVDVPPKTLSFADNQSVCGKEMEKLSEVFEV